MHIYAQVPITLHFLSVVTVRGSSSGNPHFETFFIVLEAVSKGIYWTNFGIVSSGFKNLLITSTLLLFLFSFDHYITHNPTFGIFLGSMLFLSRTFVEMNIGHFISK